MVPRWWPNSTVVCLGTGPSLTEADVNWCRGKARVIAVNDAIRLAPWADILYACDGKWWRWHEGVPTFHGPKYALEAGAANWPGVTVLDNTGHTGIETRPTGLRTGRNSGYQAINLAVHVGATRILLLGYDMTASRHRASHFFGEHRDGSRAPYQTFLAFFETAVEPLRELGITVINVSRESALTCFPSQRLEDALPASAEVAA